MKRNLRAVVTSASVLVATGGVLAATVGTAAASTPTWEPDSNALGTLAFYNSSGVQITGGSNLSHLFDYALASSADGSTKVGTKANLEFANPQPSTPTGSFAAKLDESSSTPNSTAPNSIDASGNPIVSLDANGANLAAAQGGFTANTAAGYVNVYQIRLYTSGPGGAGTTSNNYWDADVQVNGDGSWTEIYGTALTTSTTLSSTPNPSTQGQNVTFTATETGSDGTHPAGTVQFKDGSTALGSPQTVNASGVATLQTTTLSQAASPHSITAVFTPGSSTYSSSTSAPVSQVVGAAATPTSTSLTVTGNATTGTDATLSGSVSPSAAAGSVEFFDNGSTTPIAVTGGPSVAVTSGSYTATLSGGFSSGSHSVVAVFTSSAPATFAGSQSAPQAFNTVAGAAPGSTCSQTGSKCTDTQTIEGEIPTGTLVISTPYTDSSPLDIGKLVLDPTGSFWTGSTTFKCITITDASSGGSPFNAEALASTLSQVPGTGNSSQNTTNAATQINAENVGLTNLALSAAGGTKATCPDGSAPTENYTGTRTVESNTAANGVPLTDANSAGLGGATPHPIIQGSAGGEGTVAYDGTITLNAPTSTAAGTYKGTIVFTVSD